MDRRQRARDRQSSPHLLERQVRLLGEKPLQAFAVRLKQARLASREVVTRPDLACPAALLQELLNHTQGHAVTPPNLFAASLLGIVRSQDTLSQVQ